MEISEIKFCPKCGHPLERYVYNCKISYNMTTGAREDINQYAYRCTNPARIFWGLLLVCWYDKTEYELWQGRD